MGDGEKSLFLYTFVLVFILFVLWQLSSQLVETAIVEQAGSVILNKVNEVNLAIASTVSDRVIDEVVDSLSKTCKNLVSRAK